MTDKAKQSPWALPQKSVEWRDRLLLPVPMDGKREDIAEQIQSALAEVSGAPGGTPNEDA